MNQAKHGDMVRIHYTEKLDDGRIIDTSKTSNPLEIVIGRNLIPFFEKGAEGMKVGERKIIELPAEKTYGPRLKELVKVVEKNNLPKNIKPVIGKQLKLKSPDGSYTKAVIRDINNETITIDANHPLAGKTLLFEIELVEIL